MAQKFRFLVLSGLAGGYLPDYQCPARNITEAVRAANDLLREFREAGFCADQRRVTRNRRTVYLRHRGSDYWTHVIEITELHGNEGWEELTEEDLMYINM